MKNGDRKLLMGDSFPVYLSCMYDFLTPFLEQLPFEPNLQCWKSFS